MGIRRWAVRGAIGVAALLLLGFGIGALVDESGGPETADGAALSQTREAFGSGAGGAVGAAAPDAELGVAQDAVGAQLPPLGDRVIRNADLSLETREDAFESAWSRAFQVATRFDGHVVSSSRGRPTPVPILEGGVRSSAPAGDGDELFGDIVMRVPADRFEAALGELRRLGTVKGEVSSSSDVTQEFVDLESRLRHLRSEETVLLRLMGQAKTISDTLLVRQQLSQVQLQIEEITGRLRYLRSQTDLSTIALHLATPGAAVPGEGPSFAKAWRTALEGLERMATGVMIATLWAAPFAALLALGALAVRRWRGRPAPQA